MLISEETKEASEASETHANANDAFLGCSRQGSRRADRRRRLIIIIMIIPSGEVQDGRGSLTPDSHLFVWCHSALLSHSPQANNFQEMKGKWTLRSRGGQPEKKTKQAANRQTGLDPPSVEPQIEIRCGNKAGQPLIFLIPRPTDGDDTGADWTGEEANR